MSKRKAVDMSKFQHLYPFTSHYMDLNGLNYHFLDEGKGDPIVMLHGNPTWSFYFRKLIGALSSEFRMIAPDHIGCGLSDKPDLNSYDYKLKSRVDDLEALLVKIGAEKNVTLVLHDWGGFIGMAYAIRHPANISRFIVMNSAAFLPPPGKDIPIVLKLFHIFNPLSAAAVCGLNLFAYGALFTGSYKGLTKDVKSGLMAPYNSWKNRVATLKFVQDIDLSEKNPSYHIVKQTDNNLNIFSSLPMLICWGQRDFVFDMDYLGEWQRRFPDAEAHCFSEAGHYVLEDVPEKIIALTKDFLKRQSLRGKAKHHRAHPRIHTRMGTLK